MSTEEEYYICVLTGVLHLSSNKFHYYFPLINNLIFTITYKYIVSRETKTSHFAQR